MIELLLWLAGVFTTIGVATGFVIGLCVGKWIFEP